MKELIIVRHAKSSWSDHSLSDFDRPLNKRGTRDAPYMAKRILEREKSVDLIVSSPAKRAFMTSAEFGELFQKDIKFEKGIYEAREMRLLDIINNFPNDKNKVMIFGHNPGFSGIVYYLCDQVIHMPTCGVVKIKFDLDSWELVSQGNGQFIYFDYPKNSDEI